jgi:hypothetical protein
MAQAENGEGTPGRRTRALRTALLALAIGSSVQAQAVTHRALIIGVSDYQLLPARAEGGSGPFDLEGPKNDVPRMLKLAQQLGVSGTELRVLANGGTLPPGAKAPTRAAILEELQGLATRSGAGDQVLVYFSGHGAQSPDLEGEEADGLDELMLPADIGKWQDDADMVENAISDDEFGAAIEAIRKRGAYVWVIVDSCHAGTALRGGPLTLPPGFESKGVSASALGVPSARLQKAAAAARTRGGAFEPGGVVRADKGGGSGRLLRRHRREAAIGGPQPLPDGGKSPSTSLLTWAITDAMVAGQVATYRDLALRVRGYYDALGPRRAGAGLRRRFRSRHLRLRTSPPRQWSVQKQGARFVADGGALDGLDAGASSPFVPRGRRAARRLRTCASSAPALRRRNCRGRARRQRRRCRRQARRRQHLRRHAGGGRRAAGGARRAPRARQRGRGRRGGAHREGTGAGRQCADELRRSRAKRRPVPCAPAPTSCGWPIRPAPSMKVAASNRLRLPSAPMPTPSPRALGARLAAFARSQRLLTVMRALETAAPASLSASVAIAQAGRRRKRRPAHPPRGSRPRARSRWRRSRPRTAAWPGCSTATSSTSPCRTTAAPR